MVVDEAARKARAIPQLTAGNKLTLDDAYEIQRASTTSSPSHITMSA